MTGTAVDWGLGAALVIVASGAGWRLARPSGRRARAHQRTNSALHLLMAAGMAVMLVERGGAPAQALGIVFGAVAVAMLARGRLHHAAMSGIMVLMVRAPAASGSSARTSMQMAMSPTPGGQGVSLVLLAAFGYAAISACVFVWRMPGFATYGVAARRRPCAADPLVRGCEIMMLVSTAVMLLPMI